MGGVSVTARCIRAGGRQPLGPRRLRSRIHLDSTDGEVNPGARSSPSPRSAHCVSVHIPLSLLVFYLVLRSHLLLFSFGSCTRACLSRRLVSLPCHIRAPIGQTAPFFLPLLH